jgi:hypothetical protein
MSEVIVKDIFSTRFALFKNIELNHNKILNELKKLKFEEFKKLSYATTSIKLFKDMKYGSSLKEITDKYIKIAIEDCYEFKIKHNTVNCWGTKTLPGGDSKIHNHIHFWLSFCYYPHGEKKDNFIIRFFTPHQGGFDIPEKRWNEANSRTWDVPVEKGDLIIFNSSLRHQILQNTSNVDRYSIAGNILPVGKIGQKDSTVYLEGK